MKPLENLTNIEKACYCTNCFRRKYLPYWNINSMCLTIQEDEQLLHTQWNSSLFTIETWLSFVEEVRSKIDRYGKRFCIHKAAYSLTSCLMAIPRCIWCIA